MAAAPVALTDSEDEGRSPSRTGSLQARYDALEAMSKASIAGEAARVHEREGGAAPAALSIHVGEESLPPARTASFELQYDALDAGAALAAVAAASPLGGAGRRAPGFHAEDVSTMLRQRAEWLEQLGSSAQICSEDLSDQSSEWGGSDASAGEVATGQAEPERQPERAVFATVAALLSSGLEASQVDEAPLRFESARQRFAGLHLCTDSDAGEGLVGGPGRPDPPARRLRRLRAEAGAFCGWAEARSAGATSSSDGLLPLAREARQLGHDAHELAELVQRVVRGASPMEVEAVPKQVWLPLSERLDVTAAQQLLKLSRAPAASVAAQEELRPGAADGLVYELSAAGAGGWLADSELASLRALEARMGRLRTALGAGPAPQGGSLLDAAACLHQRLDALQQVSTPEACERLRAAVQLLSTEIDVAVSEARHLEAIEAEEREGDLDAELAAEETPAEYVTRLHQQVASLDAVALRVADINEQLMEREGLATELARFANDVTSAEARALQAGQVLRATATAAERMRQAADSGREQLRRNVEALERKLAAASAATLGAGSTAAA